jgi:dynein heavy chain, axonemal
MEMTDYHKITTMVKEFTPYSNLWITTHNWFANIENWMNGEWETLDAAAAERFVDDSVRTVAGCMRFFKERDIESILKIATAIKGQLDEFKPKVPLMVALRKKGMVERHWSQISAKVGFDVAPTEGFTFSKVLDMGLLKHSDVCV